MVLQQKCNTSAKGEAQYLKSEPKSTHVGILLICWKRSIMFLFRRKQSNNLKKTKQNHTTKHSNRQILNLLDKPPMKLRQAQFHETIFPTDQKQIPCHILTDAMCTR